MLKGDSDWAHAWSKSPFGDPPSVVDWMAVMVLCTTSLCAEGVLSTLSSSDWRRAVQFPAYKWFMCIHACKSCTFSYSKGQKNRWCLPDEIWEGLMTTMEVFIALSCKKLLVSNYHQHSTNCISIVCFSIFCCLFYCYYNILYFNNKISNSWFIS